MAGATGAVTSREVIQPVEGRGAQICSSRGSGLMNMGWALYASTDSGQAERGRGSSAGDVVRPLCAIPRTPWKNKKL